MTLEHRDIYIDIHPCVLRPMEAVANEASMYAFLCSRARYVPRLCSTEETKSLTSSIGGQQINIDFHF